VLGVPLYLVHTSCIDALEASRARACEGQRVFGEVLSQHLVIDDSVYRNPDWNTAAHYVMSPPFRAKEHQAALWRGLQAGMLQTTATDHCCFCTQQKQMGRERLPQDPQRHQRRRGSHGRPLAPRRAHRPPHPERVRRGHVHQRRQDLQHPPEEGRDRRRRRRRHRGLGSREVPHISAKTHHQKIDFNIYEGMTTIGNAAITLSRGRVLWENDQLKTEPGTGKHVDRPCFSPYWESQERRNALTQPTKVDRA
jgi:dihydropyrimidinase